MTTYAEKKLIENILSNPNAPMILRQVKKKLEEEREKRENFYNDITEREKAEFINGEIIIHSPVKKEHNDCLHALNTLLAAHNLKHQLGYIGYEKIMISLTRNDYEPDLCFFNHEKAKHFKTGQSLFPAPDLVVEVLSKATAANDRGVKFQDYQAHGVSEYWIIDPVKKVIEQYRLEDGMYDLILKSGEGTITSQAVPHFQFAIEALFDTSANFKELTRIINNDL